MKLPESTDPRFANTALAALETTQAHLADKPAQNFIRYEPDIAPFVVMTGNPTHALEELAGRMQPGELEWLLHETAEAPLPPDHQALGRRLGLEIGTPLSVTQMVFPGEADISQSANEDDIEELTGEQAAREMVELTNIAFPGFFRVRTNVMGPYFGIRREGRLVAMGGDRMCFAPYFEISGVCTLASYRGQGLATSIIRHILREHRSRGQRSYLHLATANVNARRLYDQLGFVFNREVHCTRIIRRG